jgi:hypothetical protein
MTDLRQYIIDNYPAEVAAQDYRAIVDALNAPTIADNPNQQGVIPKPITLKGVMALVQPAEMVQVYKQLPNYVTDLKTAIDNHDREYMAALLVIAATAGVIGEETTAALQALLLETIPDPSWTETVSGASIAQTNGWTVNVHTVQWLLNS